MIRIDEIILFFFKAYNLQMASPFKDFITCLSGRQAKKKGKRTTCLPDRQGQNDQIILYPSFKFSR